MKRIIAFIIVAVIVVVVVVGIVTRKTRTEISDVRVVSPRIDTITKAVVATGQIKPLSIADVKSRIGGVVRRFFVDEGDSVRKGQRLAEIVPTATPSELVAARERVQTAKLQLEQSRRNLKRLEELAKKHLVSDSELEEAQTRAATDAARYDAAVADLRVLEQSVAGASTGLAQSHETSAALSDMIVVSPIDGIVLSRNVDEGSSVIPMSSAYGGTSILTLADVSTMHFEGYVDESDVGKIYEGMPARIFVDAFPDTSFEGILTRIAPMGTKEEGIVSFRVEAEISGGTTMLRTGMSADVQLIIDERHDVLTLPEGAIIYEGDSTFVEIADPQARQGRRKVPVKIGLSDGIKTEIVEGLTEASRVILQ